MSIKKSDIWKLIHIPERKIAVHFTMHVEDDQKWMAFLVPLDCLTQEEAYNYFAENCARLDDECNQAYGWTQEDAILNLIKIQLNRYRGISKIMTVDEDVINSFEIEKNHRYMWE